MALSKTTMGKPYDDAMTAVRRAKNKWGSGWNFLSRELKLGAVALEILRDLPSDPLKDGMRSHVHTVTDLALGAID